MPSAAFYRKEAERYRDLATASLDPDAQAHWLRVSKDHDTLADALAADEQRHSQDVREWANDSAQTARGCTS